MELRVRNVQEAYVRGLALLREHGVWEDTRNGRALVLPEPMVTIYDKPIERVLLDPVRDANPFFHLMEAVWMLAGRNDVASLLPFNKALAQYSDNGEWYHGGYGRRWRGWFLHYEGSEVAGRLDQVRRAIELLRANPADRRVVIQMWSADEDLGREGKDFPCNTQLLFRAREQMVQTSGDGDGEPRTLLDMTICNRSNDAVWGAYGANAVHFSVLQEFIAAAAGMQTGRMIQLSNNFHAYDAVLEKVGEPCWPVTDTGGPHHGRHHYVRSVPLAETIVSQSDTYRARDTRTTPLFRVDGTTDLTDVFRAIDMVWDDDLAGDIDADPLSLRLPSTGQFTEGGLVTIETMRDAYLLRREQPQRMLEHVRRLDNDWGRAGAEWLERRKRSD
jgi:hypothetical protein